MVTEVSTLDGSTRIQGRFALPRFALLDDDQTRFLETFLRCRGMLNGVERELGLSYPTVRARLDALLEALDLVAEGAPPRRPDRSLDSKRQILDQLEQGAITPEEAKLRLKDPHRVADPGHPSPVEPTTDPSQEQPE